MIGMSTSLLFQNTADGTLLKSIQDQSQRVSQDVLKKTSQVVSQGTYKDINDKTRRIPKTIHYCWFGHNPLPDLAIKCIESWKRFCPDYKIKLWDESNFDLTSCPYVAEAYEEKRWAFVSDYARLKIIYENGGIYLDTDVEILKPLTPLLFHSCFLGTEISANGYTINTGLGFGAEKENEVVKRMLDEYEGIHFRSNGVIDISPCPRRNTAALRKLGYKETTIYEEADRRNLAFTTNKSDVLKTTGTPLWQCGAVAVYPPAYFSPMNYDTGETVITENTVSIHHYSASWITVKDRDMMKKINALNAKYPRIISQPMKHWMLYRELKEQGKAKSFIGYVIAKMKLRFGNSSKE